MKKKIAQGIAKALCALSLSDWHAQNDRKTQRTLRHISLALGRVMRAQGYELANGDGARIRQIKEGRP